MEKVKEYLENFGLSDIEVQLYLGLLETGPTTVLEIAKHTGIKRTTAHVNIETLIEKGLVAQTKSGTRRKILAEEPKKISYLLEQRKLNISRLEGQLPTIMETMTKLGQDAGQSAAVEVKYYEGKKNIKTLYEEMSKADAAYSISNADKFYEIIGEETGNMLWKALEENPKRKAYDILVDSELSRSFKNKHSRYSMKLLSGIKTDLGFDILVWDGKMAIVQLEQNNIFATVIDSASISESVKALHSVIWNLLS